MARTRCLSAGLRYLRLIRLPRHDCSPVPGGNRSAASCLCTVLRRALYHNATRSPNTIGKGKGCHKDKKVQEASFGVRFLHLKLIWFLETSWGLPCSRPLLPTRCWLVWGWCVSTLEQRSWKSCMGGLKTWTFKEAPDSTCWGSSFGPPCKRNVFQKGSESGPAWNQKWSSLEGPVLVPFWPLHCSKFVEAFISNWSWFDRNSCGWNLELGRPRACFFSRFQVQKRAPSLSYCFASISRALRPSRPASKPALTCFVLISMVSRHRSSRLALRPASNFASSYIFFWFAAISITANTFCVRDVASPRPRRARSMLWKHATSFINTIGKFFVARTRCLSAGLRYLRLTRLPRHDCSPVPGGNRSAASCLCTVLRRALYHNATRSPNTIGKGKVVTKTRRYKRLVLGFVFCTWNWYDFWRRVGASLVRGPYCQLDVGLCEVDVFLHWNSAAEEAAWVGLKPGPSRRHRIQPAEGPVLDPRAKETCFKKGQKVDPLEIKSGPPWRVQFWCLFDPFIVANLLRRLFQIEADLTVTAAAEILNWAGPAPAFSYVLRSKKGRLLCHIVLLQFPEPWGPRGLPRSLPWRVLF